MILATLIASFAGKSACANFWKAVDAPSATPVVTVSMFPLRVEILDLERVNSSEVVHFDREISSRRSRRAGRLRIVDGQRRAESGLDPAGRKSSASPNDIGSVES